MIDKILEIQEINIDWKHKKTIVDSDKFEIDGLNIWDFEWQYTNEKIRVLDPQYGQSYFFNVYKIQNSGRTILFAAGEFSNCIWGIYTKEETDYNPKFSLIGCIKDLFKKF
ncbi:MAG: hypothetical protein V4548_09180 [Bacteroidota bacterium]